MSRTTVTLSFNSAAPNARSNPGSPGETFTVAMSPLTLSPNVRYGVRLVQAQFSYAFPNVASTNNTFVYTKDALDYTVTIPDGLFTLDDLSQEINHQMALLTHGGIGSPVFSLGGSNATSIVGLYTNAGHTGYRVRWDLSTLGAELLGFPVTMPLLAENTGVRIEWAPMEASMTLGVDTLVISASGLASGTYTNGTPGPSLCHIPLAGVVPNSFHAYVPRQPTHAALANHVFSEVTLSMSDGLGRPLSCRGLAWGVTIAIDRLA
jgi:hypothetical protein